MDSKYHIEQVGDLGGFALAPGVKGDTIPILSRALVHSGQSEFYKYIDGISSVILSKTDWTINSINNFLVLIHQDFSADIYVNNFQIVMEMMAKYDVKQGERVSAGQIADIRKIDFPGVPVSVSDKIMCCLRVGWKFGLFFDLDRREKPLDVSTMQIDLGRLYRYLLYEEVYKIFETESKYEQMYNDGWFPFIEIIGNEFERLNSIYEGGIKIDEMIDEIISNNFTEERVGRISERWWKKEVFAGKREILEAGLSAFVQNGYINCIKNLLTEAEGIIRWMYFKDTGKGSKVNTAEFLKYIIKKGEEKAASDGSLLLTTQFYKYLKTIIYPSFNVETGEIDLSRHTSAHGIAEPKTYTKARALQSILILDQLHFYI